MAERVTKRICVKCGTKEFVYWSQRNKRGEKFVCPACVVKVNPEAFQ